MATSRKKPKATPQPPAEEESSTLEQEVEAQLASLKDNDEETSELGFDSIAHLLESSPKSMEQVVQDAPAAPPKRIVTNADGESVDPELHSQRIANQRLQAEIAALKAGKGTLPQATQSSYDMQQSGRAMDSDMTRKVRIYPLESGKYSINKRIYPCKKNVPISVPEYLAKRLVNEGLAKLH